MSDLELTPDNLRRLGRDLLNIYVRAELLCFRLPFLELAPTDKVSVDILREVNDLRAEVNRVGEYCEWFAHFAEAAASENSVTNFPDEFSSAHEWAFHVAKSLVLAIVWHGRDNVPPLEAISYRPPPVLSALDAEIVTRIARDNRDSFALDYVEGVLQREAALAVTQLAHSQATTQKDPTGNGELRVLQAIITPEDRTVVLGIVNSEDPVDDKMRDLCRFDRRYVAWNSNEWAGLLKVSPAAIRKSKFWKHDREDAIVADHAVNTNTA